MSKKKLHLKNLKIKSSVTLLSKTEQKTTKGGFVDMTDQYVTYDDDWTSVKTQKEPSPVSPGFKKKNPRN